MLLVSCVCVCAAGKLKPNYTKVNEVEVVDDAYINQRPINSISPFLQVLCNAHIILVHYAVARQHDCIIMHYP